MNEFTLGVEAFINHGKSDVAGIRGTFADTLDATAKGISFFARGNIVKDKLGFFAYVLFQVGHINVPGGRECGELHSYAVALRQHVPGHDVGMMLH